MNMNQVSLIALLIVAISSLILGYQSFQMTEYSIKSILWILGGVGLFLASGYSLLVSKTVVSENNAILWSIIIGALFVLLGTTIQLVGV